MGKYIVLGKSCLFFSLALVFGAVIVTSGCGGKEKANTATRQKLVLVSPHNENIQQEFGKAFSLWNEEVYGSPVEMEWRDVGGGTSAIVQYLRNVYAHSESAEIDILWGGGEQVFTALAGEGVFTPMKLAGNSDILTQIPKQFSGIQLRDDDMRWCGSALSGFGFLYNRTVLKMRKLPEPRAWSDLGSDDMFGLVALADPTQSGSAAAAYEMIIQSEKTWEEGWRKLLLVLGNAGRFYDSAGDAANAPGEGEAAVATCIDFYGALRVQKSPDMLVYVSPVGETVYTPDPIAILKNPPHPELAQRFAAFVLSKQGQALWAVKPGFPGGPVRNALGRQPIRKDVYEEFAGSLSPWICTPYQAGQEMTIDIEMKRLRAEPLKYLVRCAAVDNLEDLKKARKRVAGLPVNHPAMKLFGQLPAEARTREGLKKLSVQLKDPSEAEKIVSRWQAFFKQQYKAVVKH